MITKAQILNGADQARHFDVAIGDGHPIGYTNLVKSPLGSHYQDLLNLGHYIKVAKAGEEADWEKIGGSAQTIRPAVIPLDKEDCILGKNIKELQQDIVIGADDKIYGVLHHVTGYTGYSGSTSEQSGNYLALFVTVPSGFTGTVQKGSNAAVTLDSDGIVVFRIPSTDINIVVTVTDGDETTYTRTLALNKLVLE